MIQIFRQQPHGYRRDRATANSILEKKCNVQVFISWFICVFHHLFYVMTLIASPHPNLREIIADALSYPHVYMFYNIFYSWYIDGQHDPL